MSVTIRQTAAFKVILVKLDMASLAISVVFEKEYTVQVKQLGCRMVESSSCRH